MNLYIQYCHLYHGIDINYIIILINQYAIEVPLTIIVVIKKNDNYII